MNTILAVAGLPGAGKNEICEYLVKKTGWGRIYLGQTVVDEVRNRGLREGEASERVVREQLRGQYGPAAMVKLNLPKIREMFKISSVILESFYSWEEYVLMKGEFGERFKVLAVFASPEIRSARLQSRSSRRLSAEEFESRDISQIENLHQAGPIARADFMIINEGTKPELFARVDEILTKLP